MLAKKYHFSHLDIISTSLKRAVKKLDQLSSTNWMFFKVIKSERVTKNGVEAIQHEIWVMDINQSGITIIAQEETNAYEMEVL